MAARWYFSEVNNYYSGNSRMNSEGLKEKYSVPSTQVRHLWDLFRGSFNSIASISLALFRPVLGLSTDSLRVPVVEVVFVGIIACVFACPPFLLLPSGSRIMNSRIGVAPMTLTISGICGGTSGEAGPNEELKWFSGQHAKARRLEALINCLLVPLWYSLWCGQIH